MLVEYLLYRKNVIGRTHKRMSNKVDVFFNSKEYVIVILLRNSRQSDMLARYVHALVCTKHTVVLHLSYKHRTIVVYDKHIKFTIVKEHMITNLHILSKVDV